MTADDNFCGDGHDHKPRGKQKKREAEFYRDGRIGVAFREPNPERSHDRRKTDDKNWSESLKPPGGSHASEDCSIGVAFGKKIEGGTDLFEASPKQRCP